MAQHDYEMAAVSTGMKPLRKQRAHARKRVIRWLSAIVLFLSCLLAQYYRLYMSQWVFYEQLAAISSNSFEISDNTQISSPIVQHVSHSFLKSGPVRLDDCLVKANAQHIRPHVDAWRKQKLPLLASVLRAPDRQEQRNSSLSSPNNHDHRYWTATFSLSDVFWRINSLPAKKQTRRKYTQDDDWKCDGQPAVVIGHGCPSGQTIVIQCAMPSTSMNENDHTLIQYITWQNHSYFVGEHAQCALQQENDKSFYDLHDASSTPHADKNRLVVASVLFYKASIPLMLEWMEYHRLVLQVHHFYIYLLQDETSNLPHLSYVTYIPWFLNPRRTSSWDIFLFQTASQTDTLHRARDYNHHQRNNGIGATIQWIMYNDLDEFFVIHKQDSQAFALEKSVRRMLTLPQYLNGVDGTDQHHNISEYHDAVQVETMSFGSAIQNNTKSHEVKYNLQYNWRLNRTFRLKRPKTLVQPSRIDYVNIHWATLPADRIYKPNAWDEIWIQHYKNPSKKPYAREIRAPTSLVQDSRIRNAYGHAIRTRVEALLRAMNYTPQEDKEFQG